MLSERTQVLLTREQRARLDRIAAREGRSVGAVIREAIEVYTAPRVEPRSATASRLFTINAPVGDWQQMKDEIARGADARSSEE